MMQEITFWLGLWSLIGLTLLTQNSPNSGSVAGANFSELSSSTKGADSKPWKVGVSIYNIKSGRNNLKSGRNNITISKYLYDALQFNSGNTPHLPGNTAFVLSHLLQHPTVFSIQ